MNRRSFLTGIVKAVAATELIVSAIPEQVKAFGSGDLVGVGSRESTPYGFVSLGEMLYNANGRPICVVTQIDMNQPVVDVTMAHNNYTQLMPAGSPELVIIGRSGRGVAREWKDRVGPKW